MPARHSKSNQIRAFFTYEERKKWGGIGTTEARLGADSMRSYDSCCLCLQLAIEPMCTSNGYLYCKGCLMENLSEQKEQYQRRVEAWEAQESQVDEKDGRLQDMADSMSTELFREQQSSLVPLSDKDLAKREQEKIAAIERVRVDGTGKTLQKNANFWIPSNAPKEVDERMDRPQMKLMEPVNNALPLRVKKLTSCNFQEQLELRNARENGGEGAMKDNISAGKYMCPSCSRSLSNSIRISVLTKCGHVICTQCVKKFSGKAKKDKGVGAQEAGYTCLVCDKSHKATEIINLKPPGTGYCAGNEDHKKQVAVVKSSGGGFAVPSDHVTNAAAARIALKI